MRSSPCWYSGLFTHMACGATYASSPSSIAQGAGRRRRHRWRRRQCRCGRRWLPGERRRPSQYALLVLGGIVAASAACALAVRFSESQKSAERLRTKTRSLRRMHRTSPSPASRRSREPHQPHSGRVSMSTDITAPAITAPPLLAKPQGAAALPDSTQICSCNNVSKGAICAAIDAGCTTLGALKKADQGRQSCGGCGSLLAQSSRPSSHRGLAVNNHLCEHFAVLAPAAVPSGPRRRAQDLRRRCSRKHGKGLRLRHLQAGGRVDPRLVLERVRARSATRRRCRTPTTTSSPTCRRTAPTRSCRACPAARSRRTS